MNRYSYYFINHSKKEFSLFANNVSIMKGIADAINISLGWTAEDDIRLGSEDLNDLSCLKYLDEVRYHLAKN